MASLGERFLLLRLPQTDAMRQGRTAIRHAKRSREMRGELSAAVAALFAQPVIEPPEDEEVAERLVKLAVLVVRCRSAIERDGYTREIELIPDAEGPGRLVIVLDRLLAGLLALGANPAATWRVVETAALDSIPAIRRRLIELLLSAGEMPKADIAAAIGYPVRTTERALEDLVAHEIVDVDRTGRAHTWRISEWTARNYAAATFPEKSNQVSPNSSCTHRIDFSGKFGGTANADGNANAEPDSPNAAVGANVSNSGDGNVSADGSATPSEQLGEPPEGWTWEELESIEATRRAEEAERAG
jgi:hypothetical protein